MESGNPLPSQTSATWAKAFPRLFEIYVASDRTSAENWFQHPNVWRGLTDGHDSLKAIEDDLQILDPESWSIFRVKAARFVHRPDKWGYSRSLFDRLNETKGYRYLVSKGYKDVRFVPEQKKVRTPDLRARSGASVVLMEVKTVNESDSQKDYFEIPSEQRMAVDVEYRISPAMKNKLLSTISVARSQLLPNQNQDAARRIIYLVIRPNFYVHADEDLTAFLELQATPEIEIVHHLLG